jgi:membrane-bound metal-dependent hydrolase YbcI (DUF457 family)
MKIDSSFEVLTVYAIWIGIAIWMAFDGQWAVSLLFVFLILLALLPAGVEWVWKKTKSKKRN